MSKKLRDSIITLFSNHGESVKSLSIPRCLIDFCDGDIHAALLLNQTLLGSDRAKHPEGWFAMSYGDWLRDFHFVLPAGDCQEIRITRADFNRFPWPHLVAGAVFELTRERS